MGQIKPMKKRCFLLMEVRENNLGYSGRSGACLLCEGHSHFECTLHWAARCCSAEHRSFTAVRFCCNSPNCVSKVVTGECESLCALSDGLTKVHAASCPGHLGCSSAPVILIGSAVKKVLTKGIFYFFLAV